MWFSKCLCRLVFIVVLAAAIDGPAQTNTLPRITAIDATNFLNQQVVVIDKVVQVAYRSNIWLLHLNQKYPRSPLNATIRKSYTNNFPNISNCLGKQVELTGLIVDFRGRLELALTNPDQITILGPARDNANGTPPASEAAIKTLLPTHATTPSIAATAPPATAPAVPGSDDNSNRAINLILSLLAAIVVLLVAAMVVFWRRQMSPAPLPRPLLILPAMPAADPSAEGWKQRALVAEAMAGKQGELLREKMIPELTEFAKQSLVQGLVAQRNVLLETQRKAQQALMELETRLGALQAPLHERIRVYENRIAELEQEVETQGEEVRELTRATLTLVRRKLEDERQSERLHSRFN